MNANQCHLLSNGKFRLKVKSVSGFKLSYTNNHTCTQCIEGDNDWHIWYKKARPFKNCHNNILNCLTSWDSRHKIRLVKLTYRSRLLDLSRRNKASTVAKRDHVVGHGQGFVRSILRQAVDHGVHGHSQSQHLHSRQQQGHLLRAGKSERNQG